jgi:hypothetical protein
MQFDVLIALNIGFMRRDIMQFCWGTCYLFFTLNMETAESSETLVPTIKLHAVTSQDIVILICITVRSHVRWVPCHHGMARPQVADGGDALQVWREAANILNKQ